MTKLNHFAIMRSTSLYTIEDVNNRGTTNAG